MKVRKKPVIVEAVRWTGKNWDEIEKIFPYSLTCMNDNRPIEIDTLEGKMTAQVGDWIIRGIKGEIYPCKPDIFEKTYDIIEE